MRQIVQSIFYVTVPVKSIDSILTTGLDSYPAIDLEYREHFEEKA